MWNNKLKEEEEQAKADIKTFLQGRLDEGKLALDQSIDLTWNTAKHYVRPRETVAWLIVVMFLIMVSFQYFNRTTIVGRLDDLQTQANSQIQCNQK